MTTEDKLKNLDTDILIGGWHNNTTDQPLTNYLGNTVLIGSKSIVEYAIIKSNESGPLIIPPNLMDIKHRFLTVGGTSCKTKLKIVSGLIQDDQATKFANELFVYAVKRKFTGIDFDCEGELTLSIAHQIVTKIKAHEDYPKNSIKFQATVMPSTVGADHGYYTWCDDVLKFYENINIFDTIALMTYDNAMIELDWEILPDASIGKNRSETLQKNNGRTWKYISKWLKDFDIDSSKIVLAIASKDCDDSVVKFYMDVVNQFKLKGILFWRISEASKYIDYANSNLIIKK